MSHRSFASLLTVLALTAACGGGQPQATQPANPSASAAPASSAAPGESAAPGAGVAPSGSAAPATSAAPTVQTAPAGPPGPGEWDKWSHEQKLAYMKSAVMPKMGALFHDFDAKAFAEPGCGTCHGPHARDVNFKMPNPDLPKLPATPDGFDKLAHKYPKAMEFMSKQVVPQMAALVGEQPYDMKTGQGFGCFECHTKK